MKQIKKSSNRFSSTLSFASLMSFAAIIPMTAQGETVAASTSCSVASESMDLILSVPDVKLFLVKVPGGIALNFISQNPYRHERIKQAILDLLRQKSMATHEWGTSGYDLSNDWTLRN